MDPSTSSPVKILVVDDHPNTARTLARALSQLGPRVEVFSATSGQEALEQVNQGAVDIVITDMIMPGMTGLELIEQLQSHPAGRPTFSFLITAYEVPGLIVTAHRLKVREVIIKPVHPERICKIILQAIDEMDHAKPASLKPLQDKPFTILIADDEPDNRVLLARYLNREGYSHIEAIDGLETLEKVRNHLPDLLLLDVNMPNKDGFAVLADIRADPATEHIPVIILTAARLDPTEIQSGLNMGADDYITKPFDHKELLARIRTKLRVKQAEDVIRRQNRELNLLPEIGKELSARLNIDELATVLLKRTVQTLGAMFGHIVILNPSGMYQQTQYCDQPFGRVPAKYVFSPRLLKVANDAHQGFVIEDTSSDPRWDVHENDHVRSALVVPMFGRYHLLGLLLLTNEQPRYFKLEHLLLLQAICSQASIAIENAQLYEKMAHEQQRLAAVLQSTADAILMFDPENRLSLVNLAGQKLFSDYKARLGQPLTAGTGYDSLLQLLEQARLCHASFSGEVEWADQRVFSTAITPVQEGGCVVTLHDVSHFKEVDRVKDQFIATASHDLRNPITSINGFSHLIKQAGDLNDMQSDFVQRIQGAAATMSALVENMLNLAKMDMNVKPKQEVLDMTTLLIRIVDEFLPQAQAKGQWLSFDETTLHYTVEGDQLLLLQALRNLVGNAIKYTPRGGAIRLALECEAEMVEIKVKDTGYGIPSDDLPHVFDRFYRARHNGHDEIEGNGLGLAIVKSTARQHGGDVTVESEPGQGSCFTFSLPLVRVGAPVL